MNVVGEEVVVVDEGVDGVVDVVVVVVVVHAKHIQ